MHEVMWLGLWGCEVCGEGGYLVVVVEKGF
jgi:hypothetical protein